MKNDTDSLAQTLPRPRHLRLYQFRLNGYR